MKVSELVWSSAEWAFGLPARESDGAWNPATRSWQDHPDLTPAVPPMRTASGPVGGRQPFLWGATCDLPVEFDREAREIASKRLDTVPVTFPLRGAKRGRRAPLAACEAAAVEARRIKAEQDVLADVLIALRAREAAARLARMQARRVEREARAEAREAARAGRVMGASNRAAAVAAREAKRAAQAAAMAAVARSFQAERALG